MTGHKFLAFGLLVLLLAPYSAAQVCLVSLLQLETCALLGLCDLTSLLSILCTGLSLQITSGTYTLQVPSVATMSSLSISAGGTGSLTLNIGAALTITEDLLVAGASLVTVAEGVAVTVSGDLQLATGTTLQVAGNLTVLGTAHVSGTVAFSGTPAQGAAQDAWLSSPNSVNVSGTPSQPAALTGNGGIDGSVTFYGTASAGTTNTASSIYISGDLLVSSSSTLNLAGNLTSQGTCQVYGTLNLVGSNPTSWLVPGSGSVSITGTATQWAWLTGSGSIAGNLYLEAFSTLRAGGGSGEEKKRGMGGVYRALRGPRTSPGTVLITVSGNLQMSSSSNMEIDVTSSTSFTRYVISGYLERNGNLYVNLQGGYLPNTNDRFIFCSHSNSTGVFISTSGFADVVTAYGIKTTSFLYGDAQTIAYCTSTCTTVS